jgi:hypothetical protein
MKPQKQSRASISNNPIETLRKRLDAWRKTHEPRSRIPDQLWSAAVQVAMQCGLNKTAKTLHLDYYNLKKRIDFANAGQKTAPSFIELTPAVTGSAPECSIELESHNGAKMRIHIKGTGMPDLNALSNTFWGNKL